MPDTMEKFVCQFFNLKDPPLPKVAIGSDPKCCPDCKEVMSCSNGRYWCRGCHARVKAALREHNNGYKPIWQRH